MKNQEVKKTDNVEIILHSGVMVTGKLIPLHKIANSERPTSLNAITVKVDTPLYAKIYESNVFTLSERKTLEGASIPIYASDKSKTVLKRAFTIATIFPSTIRSLKYI